MPKGQFTKKLAVVAAAWAVSAAGLVTAASPAQALPPFPLAPGDCQQWSFPGQVNISNATGIILTFNSTGPNASGPATYNLNTPKTGTIAGGIDGNGHVTLMFTENGADPGSAGFNGDVGADGRANGSNFPWNALEPFTCKTQTPKEGPTVSFDPIFGGITAHVTDRSGVTSQCQYTADFYNRSFRLNANSTADLKIIAPPLLRNWDVDITCDNGTSTHTTTFF